jgi:bidirectional [NiFe] hydrogenase diaphorase subunit
MRVSAPERQVPGTTTIPPSDMIATLSRKKKSRLPEVLEHASGDKRFKILEVHIKKHQFRQDALIEVLHKAQELFGFLEDDLLLFIAYRLKLPASRVYGVATFYHFFTLKPKGRHTCVVCMGTACYVKGADKVMAALQDKAGVKAGETTPDGELSLLSARCIGACGIAPAVVYDGAVTPRQTPEMALEKVKGWIGHGH